MLVSRAIDRGLTPQPVLAAPRHEIFEARTAAAN
jgi:hypothetical protein